MEMCPPFRQTKFDDDDNTEGETRTDASWGRYLNDVFTEGEGGLKNS